MKSLIAWSKQPTTITGLSTLLGTLAAIATGQLTVGGALPLLTGALVSIAMPDSGGARIAVERLVADAVSAQRLIVDSQAGEKIVTSVTVE